MRSVNLNYTDLDICFPHMQQLSVKFLLRRNFQCLWLPRFSKQATKPLYAMDYQHPAKQNKVSLYTCHSLLLSIHTFFHLEVMLRFPSLWRCFEGRTLMEKASKKS